MGSIAMSTHNRTLDDQTIERVVFEVLKEQWRPPLLEWFKERLLKMPRHELTKSDRLIGDVWGDGDDAALFALEVEKRLGIMIPQDEWATVYTIQGVIDLFKRHRNHAARAAL